MLDGNLSLPIDGPGDQLALTLGRGHLQLELVLVAGERKMKGSQFLMFTVDEQFLLVGISG